MFLAALVLAPFATAGSDGNAQTAPAATEKPPALGELVKVDVVAPEHVVDDLRGGRIIVVIRNSSAAPVEMKDFEAEVAAGYGDIDLTVRTSDRCAPDDPSNEEILSLPCTIPGNEQAMVPVDVTVEKLARTGKAPVTFDVELEHEDARGNIIATASISLGVFGESELLPLLQIPSILILPGALALVALTVLWRHGVRPLTADKEFPLGASGLEFWGAATAFSALLVVLWQARYGRNLLEGYGYRDIAGVVVVAAVAVAVIAVGLLQVRRNEQKAADAKAALRVAAGDSASMALKKLAQRDAKARLKTPLVKHGAIERLVLETGEDEAIVGAHLRFRMDAEADDADVVERRIQQLRAEDRIAPLAKYVIERVDKGRATVGWEAQTRPFAVSHDAYKQSGREEPLMEADPDD